MTEAASLGLQNQINEVDQRYEFENRFIEDQLKNIRIDPTYYNLGSSTKEYYHQQVQYYKMKFYELIKQLQVEGSTMY